jgi:chromosome segregation ATPase
MADYINRFQLNKRSERDSLLLRCRDTIASLHSEIENDQQTIFSLEYEIKTLKSALSQQEVDLNEIKVKERCLKDEIEILEKENKESRKDRQALHQKAEALEDEKVELINQLQVSHEDIQEYERIIEDLKAELVEKEKAIQSWNETLSSVEERMNELSHENIGLKDEIHEYEAKYDDLLEKSENLSELCKQYNEEAAVFKRKTKELQEENEEACMKLEKERIIIEQRAAEKYAVKVEEYKDECKKSVDWMKQNMERIDKENRALRTENEQMREMMVSKERYFETKKIEYDEHIVKKDKLLQDYINKLHQIEEKYSQIQAESKATFQEKDEKIKKLETLHRESSYNEERYRYREQQLTEKLEDIMSFKDKLEESLTEKTRELEFAEKAMYKLKADITRLTQELESEKQEKQNALLEIQKIKEENLQDMQRATEEYRIQLENTLKSCNKQLEEERMKRAAEYDASEQDMMKLKDEYEAYIYEKDDENKALKTEADNLARKITEYENKVYDLQIELEQVLHNRHESANYYKARETELKTILENENANLKRDIKELQKKLMEESSYFTQESIKRQDELTKLKERYKETLNQRQKKSEDSYKTMKLKIRQELGQLNRFMQLLENDRFPSSLHETLGNSLSRLEKAIEII